MNLKTALLLAATGLSSVGNAGADQAAIPGTEGPDAAADEFNYACFLHKKKFELQRQIDWVNPPIDGDADYIVAGPEYDDWRKELQERRYEGCPDGLGPEDVPKLEVDDGRRMVVARSVLRPISME